MSEQNKESKINGPILIISVILIGTVIFAGIHFSEEAEQLEDLNYAMNIALVQLGQCETDDCESSVVQMLYGYENAINELKGISFMEGLMFIIIGLEIFLIYYVNKTKNR